MRPIIIRTSLILSFAALASVGVRAASQAPAPKTPQAKAESKLPPAVQSAFKRAYPDAVIKNVSHETEDGVEQFEIESTNHGRGLDVNYKPDGTLLVVEEEITDADLPQAVSAAIVKRYPRATMTSRERVTEKGTISYEIGLKGAPVKSVQLTPDGAWISPKPGK